MRQLLSRRDARLLLAGQMLSAFGDRALLIVLAVWMKTLTGSSAAALQLCTPLAIQGRVSAAADLALPSAQTVSIATGAALSTLVDYRILLVAMAAVTVASATYLITRRHEPVPSVERAAA